MLTRWKTRLLATAAIALSCLAAWRIVVWRTIEGRASQRIWEELTAELDIISLPPTPSTSTEWLISDPAGESDQIGLCRMKNGEVWSFAFRSHHLMSGSESMAVFRGPQDTIQLVGDYFCCEVILPFGQPASGAEFIRQLQSLPMTLTHAL